MKDNELSLESSLTPAFRPGAASQHTQPGYARPGAASQHTQPGYARPGAASQLALKSCMSRIYQVLIIVITLLLAESCKTVQQDNLPEVTTTAVTDVGLNSATCGGDVVFDGGSRVSEKGICWAVTRKPVISDSRIVNGWGIGSFSCSVSGLKPETHYYVRAFATNGNGTGYGNEVEFTTSAAITGSVTDLEGNTYSTIAIGTREWMAVNLMSKKFNDGTPIKLAAGDTEWPVQIISAYCWPNNDSIGAKKTYGALYNGYAAADPRLCPTGWHIPTDKEWTELSTFLQGEGIAGAKMKTKGTLEAGTGLWMTPNSGATNESRFSALPAGYRYSDRGNFEALNRNAFFWSSTPDDKSGLWYRNLLYDATYINRAGSGNRKFGFGVRCLKNN